ncbi:MAG: hypothetical protein N4A57_07160 [Anaeromicrobium sp.]|jgi:hypothetical protein|uniref:hypothetical protein n=1 Tax=Anaeromicrobium sp. TaxID=1929132 RepID=UPI0025D8D489|nr:hypothetical protein [Anaeromicrobium sp.]MCT4594028.1 hypothetical protein [Anaeromicrobium sp.]
MEYVKMLTKRRNNLMDRYTDLINRNNLSEKELMIKRELRKQIMDLDFEIEEIE